MGRHAYGGETEKCIVLPLLSAESGITTHHAGTREAAVVADFHSSSATAPRDTSSRTKSNASCRRPMPIGESGASIGGIRTSGSK